MKKYIKPETDVVELMLRQNMLVVSLVIDIDDTPVDPGSADAPEFVIGDDEFLF